MTDILSVVDPVITLNTSIDLIPQLLILKDTIKIAASDKQPMNIGEETQNDKDPSHNFVHNQEVEKKEAENSNKSSLDEKDNLYEEPF